MKRIFPLGTWRYKRHEVYARIAEREKDVWETCGTPAQRNVALKKPGPGSRVHTAVTVPWDRAFYRALNLKFAYQTGKGVPDDCLGYTMLGLK